MALEMNPLNQLPGINWTNETENETLSLKVVLSLSVCVCVCLTSTDAVFKTTQACVAMQRKRSVRQTFLLS